MGNQFIAKCDFQDETGSHKKGDTIPIQDGALARELAKEHSAILNHCEPVMLTEAGRNMMYPPVPEPAPVAPIDNGSTEAEG